MKIRNKTILAFVFGYFWCWFQPIRNGLIQSISKSIFAKSMELLKIGSMKLEVKNNSEAYVFSSREDVEHILETMTTILDKIGQISVADLKDLIGVPSDEIETKWGWKTLESFKIYQVREGWKLLVPDPHRIVLD